MATNSRPSALTDFQLEVAEVFFSLPASDGFFLAGGAALVAQNLTSRPTHDLDFFAGGEHGDVSIAKEQFIDAAHERGWTVHRIQETATFCRLQVAGPEELIVDLALDSPPGRPPTASVAGPTLDPRELAGRKMTALFGRAAPRDFADVFALSQTFSKAELLQLAAESDRGFDHGVFAEMLDMLPRFADADLDFGQNDADSLRAFFAGWATELRL